MFFFIIIISTAYYSGRRSSVKSVVFLTFTRNHSLIGFKASESLRFVKTYVIMFRTVLIVYGDRPTARVGEPINRTL